MAILLLPLQLLGFPHTTGLSYSTNLVKFGYSIHPFWSVRIILRHLAPPEDDFEKSTWLSIYDDDSERACLEDCYGRFCCIIAEVLEQVGGRTKWCSQCWESLERHVFWSRKFISFDVRSHGCQVVLLLRFLALPPSVFSLAGGSRTPKHTVI